VTELARVIEALLFLSPEPVPVAALADAAEVPPDDVETALGELDAAYAHGTRGLRLMRVAGGAALATDPLAEDAARRLLAVPRTPPLTPAQAETLAVVAYLQPVSRPEIARVRGVSADSAAATLLERGLIEGAGRSTFGAVLYRTTPRFERLFGLGSLADLPDPSTWDPDPGEEGALRDRLLRAGEARTGNA
jgi:segregation and condensation protein B